MAKLSRRTAIATIAGSGAALALPTDDLLAQVDIDFTPLELNANGRNNVNRTATQLDQDEDKVLDDLLNGNTNSERSDLRNLDRDFDSLIRNPGIGGNMGSFRREAQGCQNRIRHIIQTSNFGWGGIQPCIKQIDFFIGHWYPCNDILEIGKCETKIWSCLTRQPEPMLLSYYFQHMFYEMHSIFTYHPSRDSRFSMQKRQLFDLGQTYSRHLQAHSYGACRVDFERFTTATSLFFKRYYPQWC